MNDKLITIDFTEYDTIEAAKMLLQMAETDKISGMIFAVQLTHQKRRRRVMLGATGRPANDLIIATGLSAMLHCNLTMQAMSDTHE